MPVSGTANSPSIQLADAGGGVSRQRSRAILSGKINVRSQKLNTVSVRAGSRYERMPVTNNMQRSFWAISSYFNPAKYESRRRNYRIFRQCLSVPLLTVEWSQNGQFELGPDDADILVQLSGGSVLWQKERLLNLALTKLPNSCQRVAWLDCDVVFERDDWWIDASKTLDDYALVQLFQNVCDLSSDESCERMGRHFARRSRDAIAYVMDGESAAMDHFSHPSQRPRVRAFGFGWAASRKLLEKHEFYDEMIMGGGDHAMVCAAFGRFEAAQRRLVFNNVQNNHYLGWARSFFQCVRGNVGYVPGTLLHLWHGELVNRMYDDRHHLLRRLHFNPHEDIAIDENGTWRWATNKKTLHDCARQYFHQRNEDGVTT